jgi:flagellar basal body-associated protein FliL
MIAAIVIVVLILVALVIAILWLFLRRTPQENVFLSQTINPAPEMVSIHRSTNPESVTLTNSKDHSDSDFEPGFEKVVLEDEKYPHR